MPAEGDGPPGLPTMPPRSAGGLAWLVAALSLVFAGTALSARHLWLDSYYALYAGRYIVGHGIPHANVVTAVSHGAPWIDQQWLAQVLYYGAWVIGGYAALVLLSTALVTAGFAVLARLMLRLGVPPTRMFAWTLAAFLVSFGYATARPQSFGYALFALALSLLIADARMPGTQGRTWLLIPVLVTWANTHGSVLVGAGLVAAYAGYRVVRALADREFRPAATYLSLGAAAAASVVCTPYGVGAIGYYASLIGNAVLTHNVAEWAPPSPHDPLSWGFFAVAVLVVAAVAIAWRRGARPDPLLLAIAATTLALALWAFRNVPWFGFAGTLLAADTLARGTRAHVPVLGAAFRRATAGLLAALAAASAGAVATMPASGFESWIPRGSIDVAATIAARDPALRVLDDQWSAVGLLWLHPAMFGRVAFDVRVEQYPPALMSAFFDFMYVRGPRWERVTQGYDVIVVSRFWHAHLARALAQLPGWRLAYSDRDGLVLVRRALRPSGG